MTAWDVFEKHVPGGEWSDIQMHLPMLRQCAKNNAVEIGVRDGISTAALLVGVAGAGGHVWSVDVIDASKLYADDPHWTFIQGHSVLDSERIFQILQHRALDLLFIDSDHSYQTTLDELRLYAPLVKPGEGKILLHDTDLGGAGVRGALEDYAREIDRRPSYWSGSFGLGELIP
jgi:cephalosporin hydroxylase